MGPGRMAMVIERFEVYLVNLDPTQGREIQKTRSCLVISPNKINHQNSSGWSPHTLVCGRKSRLLFA